jgi:hypothetical protein
LPASGKPAVCLREGIKIEDFMKSWKRGAEKPVERWFVESPEMSKSCSRPLFFQVGQIFTKQLTYILRRGNSAYLVIFETRLKCQRLSLWSQSKRWIFEPIRTMTQFQLCWSWCHRQHLSRQAEKINWAKTKWVIKV